MSRVSDGHSEQDHPENAIVLSLLQLPPQPPLAEDACGCTRVKDLGRIPRILIKMRFVQGMAGQLLPVSWAVNTEPLNVVKAFPLPPVDDITRFQTPLITGITEGLFANPKLPQLLLPIL